MTYREEKSIALFWAVRFKIAIRHPNGDRRWADKCGMWKRSGLEIKHCESSVYR